jgi:hypothetical protein
MTDKQQIQEQAQQQAETAGGQLTTTEATARELTPEAERDIFAHISHPKKRRFLIRYGDTGGSIVKAAKLVGIGRRTHYQWLQDDPDYAEAFEQAQKLALDVVEAEIIRRGIKGYKEPIIYQGKVTGLVRRYSDNLLMFYAKRRDPQYRDNWTQQIGIMAGGKVQIAFVEPERGTAISST